MTRTEIEDAVYTWLSVATGITVIVAEPSRPRPATPYATLKVVSVVAFGLDDDRGLSDPGAPAYATRTHCGSRVASLSIQFFGSGALDYASQASRALMTETARSQLATAGLSHRGVAPTVTDFTGLLDTDYQERAQFDVDLAFGEEYTDTVPLIETVEVGGTYQDPPNADRTETFTVSKP